MESIKKRLDFIEKYLETKNAAVGVVLPSEKGFKLFCNGAEHIFTSEAEAIVAFHRMAGPDAVLILW